MNSRWLLLGTLGATVAISSPAEAANLVTWRFDSQQNRLVFQTDGSVRPKAQLIFNPTRIAIDLPGTRLGSAMQTQNFNGAIEQVRVAQFDQNTTRLVIALAPGYTVDPQQVRVRGQTPTQWSVQLPSPQLTSRPSSVTPPPPPAPSPSQVSQPRDLVPQPSPSSPPNTPPRPTIVNAATPAASEIVSVTRNGLLLALAGGTPEDIEVERSDDRRQIEIAFSGSQIPRGGEGRIQVDRYGIESLELARSRRNEVRAILTVDRESPNWQVYVGPDNRSLVLLPEGGMSAVRHLDPGPGSPPPSIVATSPAPGLPQRPEIVLPRTPAPTRPAQSQLATIESLSLTGGNTHLLLHSDRAVRVEGTWNPSTRLYRLQIPNARLSDRFREPRRSANSPFRGGKAYQRGSTAIVEIEIAPGLSAGSPIPARNGRETTIALQPSTIEIVPPPSARRPQPLPVDPPLHPTPGVPVPTPSFAPPRNPQSAVLVTIDPGHGGKDPGAIGIGGMQEKHVVLDISHHVREILEREGLRVQMTRSDDRFISLADRSRMANSARATLFVSIHANAISMSRPDVNGVETFYYSSGRQLAGDIQRSILQDFNMRDRGVKQANFYVLRHSSMPAVLVEVGFVTGREDAAKLADPNFRRQMAEAIARGILRYVRR